MEKLLLIKLVKYTVEEIMPTNVNISQEDAESILDDFLKEEQLSIPVVSNRYDSKYTPPFRVGRKQGKAVLDGTGREVIFFKDSEEQAKMYCNYLNGCNHQYINAGTLQGKPMKRCLKCGDYVKAL